MIEDKIFSTVSSALDVLFSKINEQCGYPVVHDPQSNHDECVKEYRVQLDKRYKEQGRVLHPSDLTPTLIGWDRGSLRFQESTGVGGKRNSVVVCGCPEVDSNGDLTGNVIVWKGLRGEVPIRFRVYSTDVRSIEKMEILYMAQMAISNIKELQVFVNPRYIKDPTVPPLLTEVPDQFTDICKVSQFNLEWDFSNTNISFQRDESFVITYEFDAVIRGEFLFGTGNAEAVGTNVDGSYYTYKPTFVLDARHLLKLVADIDSQ